MFPVQLSPDLAVSRAPPLRATGGAGQARPASRHRPL